MTRKTRALTVINLCSVVALLVTPLSTMAQDLPPVQSVIITEVQTGSSAAADEFIELHNPTENDIGLTGWQLRYIPVGSTTSTRIVVIPEIILPAHKYYTVHSQTTPAEGAGTSFAGSMVTKTDKTIALFGVDLETCQLVVQDAVAWTTANAVAVGEGTPVDASAVSAKEKLLQRRHDAEGRYVDTNNNSFDFVISEAVPRALPDPLPETIAQGATPGWVNGVVLPGDVVLPALGPGSPLAPLPLQGCELPSTTTPAEPDPASSSDPEPAPAEPPQPDPDPQPEPEESEPPIDEPADMPVAASVPNEGLAPPIITELLPDPAEPLSDELDEFIELYNQNDAPFDLSGYMLETGIATKHRFVFSAGTVFEPQAYAVFRSLETDLTLTNSGGQVSLFDPAGVLLVQTAEYPAAKAAQTWAVVNGVWQWTNAPTPGAANVAAPAAVAKVASAAAKVKTTKAKTAAAAKAKTAAKPKAIKTTKTAKESAAKQARQSAAAAPSRLPLHTGVLALVALFALLYGAYEYRHDLANKFHQLRGNRKPGRTAGTRAKGR